MIKLFVIEKRIIRLKNDVEKWIILLIDKFKEFITIIIDVVFYKHYIMRDAIFRKEFWEYAQKILRSIKDAKITLIKNQFDIIYNDLNLEFRRDVKKSENFIIVNAFLTILDDYKHK